MGKQKEDLDISPPGGRSEREESAGECSLTQHELPLIVIGCITHACKQVSYTVSDRIGSISWHNGIWEGAN